MKKLAIILLSLCTLMGLAACQNETAVSTNSASPQVAEVTETAATETPEVEEEATTAPEKEPTAEIEETTEIAPEEVVETEPESIIDEATGLPINPAEYADVAEFIVEGEIYNLSLLPQDNPSFNIKTESGVAYLVASQKLSEIFMLDGTVIAPHEFRKGMTARATVHDEGEVAGLAATAALTSSDFVILDR